MASCTSCKKRTTSFCFKHKLAVCDDCTVQPLHAELVPCLPCDPYGPSLSTHCVAATAQLPHSSAEADCMADCRLCALCWLTGNYFDWLTSGEYEWPQRCGVCNRSVGTGEGEEAQRAVARLVCKCLYHRGCLYEELSKAKKADAPLQDDRVSRRNNSHNAADRAPDSEQAGKTCR